MGFLSVIRRWALRDKMPIREIARRTGLSRNTIKKYLREDSVEPRFNTPRRPSKLDPYADRLSAWLLAQTRKSRKERRNVKLMYEDLVKLGYDGSYERVAAFARAWRADRHRAEQTTGRGTFVPLVFQPGEAFQFDWSEDWAAIGGERIKLQVAHSKLSHSRAFIVRAYPLQTHEMLFDAHWHAFRVFGGIPGRGIYDNMKTAVDRVGRGKQRDINARFKAMASHYVFEPEFCNPAAGWEKGQVEKNVRDARNRLWQVMPVFKDLGELNQWLEDRCIALWSETAHRELSGSIADAWEAEKPVLMVLPPAFDGFVEHSKRVSPTCLITFERNRYSVPASFANRPVSLRVTRTGWLLLRRDRLSARMIASSIGPTASLAKSSMIGAIIWRSSNANRGHYAMVRRLQRCPTSSVGCKITCSVRKAVTGKWSTSCPWFYTTTKAPFCVQSNWRWKLGSQPRRTS